MLYIKIQVLLASIIAATMVMSAGSVARAASRTGRDVFLEYKCNGCHTVESEKIGKDESLQEEADPDEGVAEGEEEVKPPDLSGVGLELKSDFIKAYLKKKEKIEGRKHKKKFKGTPTEMDKLAGWLESLKTRKK